MQRAKLKKSKDWLKKGFEGLGFLTRTQKPIQFTPDSLSQDVRYLEETFNGKLTGKNGQDIAVFTEIHHQLENLVLLEFIDLQTGSSVGNVTLLFQPKLNEICIGFFDLLAVRGQGYGKILSETFRSYIPAGIRLTFAIDEIFTKNYLLFILDQLMEKGEITDWRVGSPLRPTWDSKKNDFHPLPKRDQDLIEKYFLAGAKIRKSPILNLFRTFGGEFSSLRTGLRANGKWVFEVLGMTQRTQKVHPTWITSRPKALQNLKEEITGISAHSHNDIHFDIGQTINN